MEVRDYRLSDIPALAAELEIHVRKGGYGIEGVVAVGRAAILLGHEISRRRHCALRLISVKRSGTTYKRFLSPLLRQATRVIEVRTGQCQGAIVFDSSRHGVSLGHGPAAQLGSVFAGDVLPGRFTPVVAEGNLTV